MKKIIMVIIFICVSFCLISCTATKTTTNNSVEEKEKYVVTLTKDNWEKYITIEEVPYESSVTTHYHYFRGALAYAYYDNVIVTYELVEHMRKSPYTITQTEKTLLLNAGGCATITISNDSAYLRSYENKSVSGTITYWI